ncbi:hypothetical protein [Streptomyces mirabilis]|uniref:hypothetical protein n=1 Tax=Streptomyces mirabilis TaxID=68239 RepID=UPI00331D8E8E
MAFWARRKPRLWASASKAHAAIPQGAVELGEASFGVFAAAVEALVNGGVVGDLQEVFGLVEAGFGVAVVVVAFAGCGGDADGFAVFVGAVRAQDGEQVSVLIASTCASVSRNCPGSCGRWASRCSVGGGVRAGLCRRDGLRETR